MIIPKLVFIIPYRDRLTQKFFFDKSIKEYMEYIKENNYKIFYICQDDNREFNRGAMKNLGFLYIKYKYPNDYKNITLVFNDVDTILTKDSNIKFDVSKGETCHYYGKPIALGGIFAIKGEDFEKINGFPNLWFWGFEDNVLNERCIKFGININRDVFYSIKDNIESKYKYILRLDKNDSSIKRLSRHEIRLYRDWENGNIDLDGLNEIINVDTYEDNDQIIIKYFECGINYNKSVSDVYDYDFLNTDVINYDILNTRMKMKFV